MGSRREPTYSVTIMAQKEKYATLCHAAHWVATLMKHFNVLANDSAFVCRNTARELLLEMEREDRFGRMLTTPNIALLAAAITPHHHSLSFVAATKKCD